MNSSKKPDAGISRRRLVRHFVAGTAGSTLLGRQWVSTLMADCQPVRAGAGILRVKLSEYPALQTDGGAVRLALNPFVDTNQSVTPFYPVLVNRAAAGQFHALSSRCTHQGCVVGGYDSFSESCVCPCHGSVFAIDGRRISGPASGALTKYPVWFDGVDLLCIEIPSLGFSITSVTAEDTVGARLRLQFPTKRNVRYELRFRESVSDPGIVVPFAKAPDGPMTETVVSTTGNSTVTLYVDRTSATGFYGVAIQVTEE